MIQNLIIKIAKKYIIKALEEYLENRKENLMVILCAVKSWTARLQIILDELNKISNRLEDGKIEDKEIDDSVKEIKDIIDSW